MITIVLPSNLYTEIAMRMQQNFFNINVDYTICLTTEQCVIKVYTTRCYEFIHFYYRTKIIQ